MEKIKKLLFSQTIKDISVSFVGLGVTALVGFVYTVVIARLLGPEQFGVFSAISALVAIIYSLGDLGIAPAMINFLPKVKKERAVFINTGFWFESLAGLVILVLFVLFALFRNLIVPGSLPEHLLLAGLLSFNYLLISFAQAVFTADRQFLKLSLSQIIDAVAKILLVFIFLSFSQISITTVFIANIFSTILALIITFGKNIISVRLVFDDKVSSHIFHFSKWIAVSRVFSVFISRIDVLLLNLFSSNYDAGIFAAGSRVTLLFALVVSSLGSVVTPRFSEFKERDRVVSYIKRLLSLIFFLCFFMVVVVIFARPIIEIVFGNEYLAAIPVFQFLTLAMIPFVFQVVTTSALLYTYNQSAFYAKVTAFQVVTIIILDLTLIPLLHVYAPVFALALTNILVLIISSIKLKNLSKQIIFNHTP